MFFGRSGPNEPVVLDNPRPEKPELKSNTGDAGRDGYTVLSAADRLTGNRPQIGSRPRGFSFRQFEE